jgi:hypothetical protein
MLQYYMPGKHLLGLFFAFFLAGCINGLSEKAETFQFQPDADKLYQVELYTVSTSKSLFGISSDTISFRFDISPFHVDSTGINVRMIIRELRQMKQSSIKKSSSANETKFGEMMKEYLRDQRRILDAVAGDSLTLFINTQGQLLHEDRLAEVIKNLSQKTNLDEARVKLTVREFLSPAVLGDVMTELFFYLPVKSIRVGDSWVKNTMFMAHAPVKYSNMIKVDTIQNVVVHLSVNTRISAGGDGNIYMDGNRTGTVIADRLSGFPLNANFIDETVTRTTGGEISRTRQIKVRCMIKRL